MKKSEQKAINDKVLKALKRMDKEILSWDTATKLRSCKATVYESTNFYILISYNTIVACIEKSTDTLFDFLRYVYGYTATSAQHIAKFNHDYCAEKWGCKNQYRYYDI